MIEIINDPSGIAWLRDAHLRHALPSFAIGAAVLFGNEDAPTELRLYRDANPRCDVAPDDVYLQDPETGILRRIPENFARDAVQGYVTALLWTESDYSDDDPDDTNWLDQGEDFSSFSVASRARIVECVLDFIHACGPDVVAQYADLPGASADRFGHDFWLTRNGHGAGFWDRGYGLIGDILSDHARFHGSADCYRADDGTLNHP